MGGRGARDEGPGPPAPETGKRRPAGGLVGPPAGPEAAGPGLAAAAAFASRLRLITTAAGDACATQAGPPEATFLYNYSLYSITIPPKVSLFQHPHCHLFCLCFIYN